MSARATIGGVLASLGILVAGWQIGTAATSATVVSGASEGTGSAATGSSSSGSSSAGGSAAASSDTTTDGTYTGAAVSTRWGDVQVEVTLSGGQITDVVALQLTDDDGRSVQISNRAAPILRSEVLAAQSADVANVSGATYTSNAYLQSLQSALDQAGL